MLHGLCHIANVYTLYEIHGYIRCLYYFMIVSKKG